jgi:hypothetical protein
LRTRQKTTGRRRKVMNGLRMMLIVLIAGSAVALSGCGKKSEPAKPAVEHTEDDGHEDHTGHNH